jgi:hypothetical protein
MIAVYDEREERMKFIAEKTAVFRVWWVNLEERDHLGDVDVGGRILLIYETVWNKFFWLRIGNGVVLL